MKDAAHLRLPSWPSRVLFLHRSRRGAASDDDDNHSNSSKSGRSASGSSTEETDLEANKNPAMLRTEPAYHRLQSPDAPGKSKSKSRFKQRKVRWALFSFVLFGTITIILLSTLLSRHAVGGIDTLFKV